MTYKKTAKMKIGDVPALGEIIADIEASGSDHVPTFGGSFEGGIQLQQVPDEIAPCILAILVSGEPVRSFLEVGVAAGGTTVLFNRYFHPKRIVLIDDNRHPKAHVRPYILDGICREEIIGDSRHPETASRVTGSFDLVLIDGDHTYPGVKADVENYLPKLRSGGFLILHDSALPEWGVYRLAGELKEDPRVRFVAEYVTEKHTRPCGVALFVKEAAGEDQ